MAKKAKKKTVKKKVMKKKMGTKSNDQGDKFLEEKEMRLLADYGNEVSNCGLQMKIHEQFQANCNLKGEKLLLEAKLMEREVELAKSRCENVHQEMRNKNIKLKELVEKIKEKYNIKDTSQGLKYDNNTGRLVSK